MTKKNEEKIKQTIISLIDDVCKKCDKIVCKYNPQNTGTTTQIKCSLYEKMSNSK